MTRAATVPAAAAAASPSRPIIAEGRYIAGRAYDWFFFILSPLLAALVGWLVSALDLERYRLSSTNGQGVVREIAVVGGGGGGGGEEGRGGGGVRGGRKK
jgi:hypothetical protein